VVELERLVEHDLHDGDVARVERVEQLLVGRRDLAEQRRLRFGSGVDRKQQQNRDASHSHATQTLACSMGNADTPRTGISNGTSFGSATATIDPAVTMAAPMIIAGT
jgi:hypothetical protein